MTQSKQEPEEAASVAAPNVHRLSSQQRAWLQRRLRSVSTGVSARSKLARRKDATSFPLSFAQERFWFLWCLEPEAPVYNVPLFLTVSGTLEPHALEQALSEIVRRHAVLRATFPAVEGAPTQVIRPWEPLSLPVQDLSAFAAEDRQTALHDLASQASRAPFDLAAGPLMRASLVRLDTQEHLLLLAFHHIVFDGWSSRLLRQELEQLYRRFHHGETTPLTPLSLEYVDYAAWQHRCLEAGVWEEDLRYWKTELSGPLPVLDLPIAGPRPATSRYHGATVTREIPLSLSAELKTLCEREQVTMFMLLLTAYTALLHRYSGQEDIVVGCPIAGRTHVETEPLIGCFINTLALRSQLRGKMSFRELLIQVREKALAAFQHQTLPFEKVVEAIHPARVLNSTPVFQTHFNFRNLPTVRSSPSSPEFSLWSCDRGVAQFDLSLEVMEHDGGTTCVWAYDADLFQSADIQRLAGHYQTLLEGIVADPESKIGQLPLLTEAERHQILVEWNDTQREYPRDKCLHEVLQEQAARTPDAVAVVFEDERLTYSELNRRANQLAHRLRSLGVGRETLVGLCVGRSPQLLVGILGILKSGGAYLPLDASPPCERLQMVVQDAKVTLVITEQPLVARLPFAGCRFLLLDAASPPLEEEAPENPPRESEVTDLAYVMYTSGSTGIPKGVQIEHRGVVNLLAAMQQLLGLTENDALLAVTTPTFDVSVLELLLPLIVGARIVVASESDTLDGQRLASAVCQQGVTFMHGTPATWQLLLQSGWQGDKRLTVLCGGEALRRELAAELLRGCREVWNHYGPTETTIDSTCQRVRDVSDADSIGRPLANTRVYVLDASRQLVPVGVPGELYIGGDGLARGYLRRPELTAERFAANPFQPGDRFYRTGDRVRWRADGTLEFLGRLDHQIKLRGFRIELGEVEIALGGHPGVQSCVVVAREDRPGDKRLVAYWTPRPGIEAARVSLREHLRAVLPEYMVPSAFVQLESLPLNANGKVNRSALPLPNILQNDRACASVGPRNAVEEQLAGIYADVLGLASVGIHDNFFDLGGHSLLAMQVVSRVNRACQVDLAVRAIFESPTVTELARVVRGLRGPGSEPSPARVSRLDRGSHLQQRRSTE